MAVSTKKPWTADELVRLPAGWRYEIEDGELVIMSPASWRHNRVVTRVTVVLDTFVRTQGIGQVLAGETGIYVRRQPRETLRGVDVAYWSAERVAQLGDTSGFSKVPPDLAVEVDDPSEPDLKRKVTEYLGAGVRSVWVLDPVEETLTRHAPGEQPRTLGGPDAVVADPVLPGFSCRLDELFEPV